MRSAPDGTLSDPGQTRPVVVEVAAPEST